MISSIRIILTFAPKVQPAALRLRQPQRQAISLRSCGRGSAASTSVPRYPSTCGLAAAAPSAARFSLGSCRSSNFSGESRLAFCNNPSIQRQQQQRHMRYSSYSNSASRDRGARREQMTPQLLRQDSDIGGGLGFSVCVLSRCNRNSSSGKIAATGRRPS